MQKAPYHYGGRVFKTLRALQAYLSPVIDYDNRVVGREFFDDVLADVVVDRHYRWAARGVRPSSFQFMRNGTDDGRFWNDSLAGLFGDYGWQRFSYKKCMKTTQPTMRTEFRRLCRERWAREWRHLYLRPAVRCSHPGCGKWAEDVDHVNPEHEDIVRQCWEVLGDEADAWWHTLVHEPPGKEHFVLPEDHPVTLLYDELTQQCTLVPLCKPHHREATRRRKIR